MKKLTSLALVLAAASPALLSNARAQIVTFDTIDEYESGDSSYSFQTNEALSQTMTNVIEITNMTYRFVQTGSTSTGEDFTAYFVAWNTSTNKPASSTPIYTDSFTVPATTSGSWSTDTFATTNATYQGYDVTLDVDQLLNPNTTYAMIIVDTGAVGGGAASGAIGLMGIENGNYGDSNYAFQDSSGNQLGEGYFRYNATSLSHMTTIGASTDFGGSWGFEQLDVVPQGNQLVTLPEPRAAAAAISALFVAVLVGRQLLLRRHAAALSTLAI